MNPNLNKLIEECDNPTTSKDLQKLRDILVDIKNGKKHFGIGNYVRRYSFSYNLLMEIIGEDEKPIVVKIKRDQHTLNILK